MSDQKPGYLIQFTKQTAMAGEMVTINTNLPQGASEEEIGNEIIKLGNALDFRTLSMNAKVLKRTGKNMEELGIIDKLPGFSDKVLPEG